MLRHFADAISIQSGSNDNLIAGNGVFAWGDSIEQAYLRLELCEHLARITLLAHPLGGPKALPESMLPALLEARRRAGLGPEGRSDKAAGAKAGATVNPAAADHVAALIRQELAAALKRA